jgi:hypothetical protein
LLSYDSVFLAMILSAPFEQRDEIETFRCATHPGRKRNIAVRTEEIDYAADLMLLLGYFNLKDDWEDESRLIGYAGERFLRRAYQKMLAGMRDKALRIKTCLTELHSLEQERTESLDRVADPFARIMEEVMDYPGLARVRPSTAGDAAPRDYGYEIRLAYRRIGHYLGKWIYLIDAIDDLETDEKKDSYNPLRFMRRAAPTCETDTEAGALYERLKLNLQLYLSEIAQVMELLPFKKNSPILENIVYVGLNMKTEEILCKLKENVDAESI